MKGLLEQIECFTQSAQSLPSEYPGHGLLVLTNTCACRHIATVRILEPLGGGGVGGQKVFFLVLE